MNEPALQLDLPEELFRFVERRAEALGFDSAAAYVESLVREARREAARERAEQLVAEGVASGDPIVADEAFWTRLRSELNSRIRYPKTA